MVNLQDLEKIFLLLIKYNINSFHHKDKDGEEITINGISEPITVNNKKTEEETVEEAIMEYLNQHNK